MVSPPSPRAPPGLARSPDELTFQPSMATQSEQGQPSVGPQNLVGQPPHRHGLRGRPQ